MAKETVCLFPLGGIGRVTKNMFVYEYRIDGVVRDTILIDCGIGFPDETMYGVDFVIPDISYLSKTKHTIRGLFLTHGHDDHIGALPYVLPDLRVPVFATKLTAAFVQGKLAEADIKADIRVVAPGQVITFGAFSLEYVHITHSVPDAANIAITTPIGRLYHGSDFKFDFTPLDGRPSDLGAIAEFGKKGVLCLLSDCLGSERPGYTLSEQVIEESIENAMRTCKGKFIFTTVSSNILRIGKVIEVAHRYHRKIAFIGRSIEKNMEIAKRLEYVSFSSNQLVYEKQIAKTPGEALCLIVAGSQGQTDSALSRIGSNEHKYVQIKEGDRVFFSADPIPGNESAVHTLIDALTASGAEVSYSDVVDDVHVSGHGSQQDLRLMLALTKPRYMLPIGGTYRHMIHYKKLAVEMGHRKDAVLIPQEGDVLEFSSDHPPRVAERVATEQIMVDGLGIGDVGEVVLRDRQTLASEGIVVIIVPVEEQTGKVRGEMDIISRGFIYMKESGGLVKEVKQVAISALQATRGRIIDWQFVRRDLEHRVSKFLLRETGRKPLVVGVVLEV